MKKRKLDGSSSSSGSASDVKQGGEAAMEDPPPTEIADILKSLSASLENKARYFFDSIFFFNQHFTAISLFKHLLDCLETMAMKNSTTLIMTSICFLSLFFFLINQTQE